MKSIQENLSTPDMLNRVDHESPSVFLPENMLRETQRQRRLPGGEVPAVCLLDPDGDIVRHLVAEDRAVRSPTWACYHTELWETGYGQLSIGIVPCAVGAPFAVLVAEQLFASGCQFLVSISSAGRVGPDQAMPDVILIERALRGEGTSHAYLPQADAIDADPSLIEGVSRSLERLGLTAGRGTTWTTDAPFRETAAALERAWEAGATVVEMEAAALYAFGAARNRPVVCFAHVTNAMAVIPGDFEKGPANGAEQALAVVVAAARGWAQEERETRLR
jgi:uridine phosphorylase